MLERPAFLTWTPAMDERLCELVSTDAYTFGEIARIMGHNRDQITSRWKRICTAMGPQAA